MPTRTQAEFERSLVEALRSNNVANAISEAIISTITKKLAEKFNYYDAKIASLEAEINLLKSDRNDIASNGSPENNRKLEQKVDSIQQHSKNNNIRLMGVKESGAENTLGKVKEIIANKLNVVLSENDVACAYRVGKKSENRPRHIIVEFESNSIKTNIYNNKRLLKGTGYVMKEDLTALRLRIVKEASDKYGFKNVWTLNGNVFAKTNSGVERIINNIIMD
nr:unnamed protein product [Callosobruchus chinensis]